MDRSFLTDEHVVAESRKFVCIRLATYEDEREAEFLKNIYTGRSGEMENTTFAILSPDGKQKLTASGRGPFHEYRNAAQMAMGMQAIASKQAGAEQAALGDRQLPLMKNVELALNVASCDNLPVIVTVATDEEKLAALNRELLPVAWSEALAGQFVYAAVTDKALLKPLTGVEIATGILVVQPDEFGLSGAVLRQFASADQDELTDALREIVQSYPRPAKTHDTHVRLGIELGIEWESEIPETDPQSIRARRQARGDR